MDRVRGRGRGGWYKQTRSEQDSYRHTVNLFFGALLGANLGTLGGLSVEDYIRIVATLLGAVMALQLVTAARSKNYALAILGVYAALLGFGYSSGALRPAGLSEGDFAKVAATLAMWVVTVAVIEMTPLLPDDDASRP